MMATWMRVMVMVVLALVVGCGSSEVRERPEDCDRSQYFHQGQQACRTCPAVIEPTCMPGCGLEVVKDHRGCPILRCEPGCEGCDEGEVWDSEAQRCEAS